jgi:hypothetical protein
VPALIRTSTRPTLNAAGSPIAARKVEQFHKTLRRDFHDGEV